MILSELVKLYDRLAEEEEYRSALPRRGMSVQKISFEVILDRAGNLVDVVDAKKTRTIPPSKKGGREKVVQVPRELVICGSAHPSGSAATPRFLWDTSAYILGYYTEKSKKSDKDKAKAREVLFPAYRNYHIAFAAKYGIEDMGLGAVCKFLSSWDPANVPDEIKEKLEKYADNFGAFRILGETTYVYESAEIMAAWQKECEESGTDAPKGVCLVTGAPDVSLAKTLETKIKIGTTAGGCAFVSFNAAAYESYGKSQTLNSPISIEAGFKACNALNMLLADRRFNVKLAETTVVFWTEKKTQSEDVLAWLLGEAPGDVGAVDPALVQKLNAFWHVVRKTGDPDALKFAGELDMPFYMLGIEPNAARIVIRFWHVSTLGDLVEKLRLHHQALSIQKTFESDPDRLTLRRILVETAREAKGIPPLLSGALLRSVIEGLPYPTSLYQLVLNRVGVSHADDKGKYRVGRKVTYGQAAIIKAFLIRNKGKEELTMSLNTENKNPAYLLGRLFATLEKTQDEASGGVNAGVGDKFYSSASATPKIVFPTILDMYRKWVKKLSAEKPGRAIFFEKLVQEILDSIDSTIGFPANLSLEDRGFFAIGYYQQMRAFFTKKDDESSDSK